MTQSLDPSLTASYNYTLPPELIAAYPPQNRGESRLLLTNRTTGSMKNCLFSDLLEQIRPHDLLVFNDAKVIPARIHARRATGGKVEIFVVTLATPSTWETPSDLIEFWAMTRASNRLKLGTTLFLEGSNNTLEVSAFKEGEEGKLTLIRWQGLPTSPLQLLKEIGETPLPPYIVKKRKSLLPEEEKEDISPIDDKERYQNVFAKMPGAVAAPTAGLHFTQDILEKIQSLGAHLAYVTLEVGPGTFKPVSTERITDHPMHSEYYTIDDKFIKTYEKSVSSGGRIIAIGTTSMRVLEAESRLPSPFVPGRRSTKIFLSPLNPPICCDGLLTNFHLPESTLFSLVAGFLGIERTHAAYAQAIEQQYKFYSYGDCMLIL